MTWRQAAIAAAVLLAAVLALLLARRPTPPAESSPDTVDGDAAAFEADGDQASMRLFFPGAGGWLVVEERAIAAGDAAIDPHSIAAELLAGPTSPGLYAPFPEGTEVGSVYVSPSGIAYVDLVSTRPDPPRAGSRDEMLSVYSLVNSVQANVPGLSGVVLLWNGQQRTTFAGHLDTGRPLTQNRSLVARR